LLDRLAHHATVITTKGKRYRMRKRSGREPPRMIRRCDCAHVDALTDPRRA